MKMQAALAPSDCTIQQADGWPGHEAAFETALGRVWGASLPSKVGDWIATPQARILRLAPRRFWRIGPGSMDPIPLDGAGALTPLAEGRVAFPLAGPEARARLAEFIAVDWDDPACGAGRAVLAGIHRIPVCVLCLAPERWELIVPRSFARSIGELL